MNKVEIGGTWLRVMWSPDERTVLVSGEGELVLIDPTDLEVLFALPLTALAWLP